VERVLHCGLPDVRAALDRVVERYLGYPLDKSVRAHIGKEGLTVRVIRYAADDIRVLPLIREKQQEQIKLKDLGGAVNLENRFTPALAYIEYCGFHLDAEKWQAKIAKDLAELQQAENALNDWVLSRGWTEFMEAQLDLFEPVGCTINWASPRQVIQLFEKVGIACTVIEKGGSKKSIEAHVLEKQAGQFPLIPLYLRYKKAQKITGTYGENFLRQIHPVTGRLHTSFTQIMDTGRTSSGGKNRETGEEYINFQNIPADKDTRACFTAEPGNTLVIADYSGQEQIVLANKALDPNLLQFYDNGLGDMHSFVASKMYPELEGLSLDEIKTRYKHKRQAAKSAGFAINYGGTGGTIADNLGLTKQEGEKIYQAYFQAFPGLKKYFEQVKKQGLRDGYILISEVTRRKSYLPHIAASKELEQSFTPEFWEQYAHAKTRGGPEWETMRMQVSDYFLYKGETERKALNFPIQGTSAEITKISCVYIFKWILEQGLFGVVKFVNTVHDENIVECPEGMKDSVADVVKRSMCDAGDIFCKRVPLKAEPDICGYWRK
jgi:DNA polymerase-1